VRGVGGIAAKFGLSVAAVVLVLLVAEIAMRIAHVGSARFVRPREIESADKRVAIDAYPSNPRGYFDVDLRDRATRTRLESLGLPSLERVSARAPFAVELRLNRELCRDADPPRPVGPGRTRVLVLGDSFTEGQGVRESDTFVRLLERRLRADGRAIDLVNCGRRGRDFPELHEAFERLVAIYQPDVVLYAMVLNDPVQSPAFRARQAFLNDYIVDRRRTQSDDAPAVDGRDVQPWYASRVLSLVRDRIEAVRVARETTRWYLEMYGAPNREGWERTRGYLAEMNATMHARGGRFLIALLPLIVGLDGTYPFQAPHAEIARACRVANIPFVDVLPALQGQHPSSLWVHEVDLHPNERAHALIASGIEPALVRRLDAH
jgi:lysophospholipase L1-like esterase